MPRYSYIYISVYDILIYHNVIIYIYRYNIIHSYTPRYTAPILIHPHVQVRTESRMSFCVSLGKSESTNNRIGKQGEAELPI
jgi:hypothetical protein